MNQMSRRGWIGVDLDGTLAHYDGWKSAEHIGEPVPAMLARVKQWLAEGREVRIFTARAYSDGSAQREVEKRIAVHAIKAYCVKHLGQELQVTCTKDYSMIELWDDRCVRVELNTGEVL